MATSLKTEKRKIMKKTLSSVAFLSVLGGASLSAADWKMPEMTLDMKGSFETEYVYRGRKQGSQNFQFGAEMGTEVMGGHLYGGSWFALMLQDAMTHVLPDEKDNVMSVSMNEVAPYIGYSYGLSEDFMIDGGYIAHIYSNLKPWSLENEIYRNTNELYLGLAADVIFSPKLYFSYDFEREEFCAIMTGGYSYDLHKMGLKDFSLEAKAEIGYDYSKKPFGFKNYFTDDELVLGKSNSKDYFFFGVGANAAYMYNENAKVKVGFRYAGNTGSKGSWQNRFFGKHKNMCWFTSSVECSF